MNTALETALNDTAAVNSNRPVRELGLEIPEWISQDITVADIHNISHHGCESGCYMPAVTYYQARGTMNEHGDDVLALLEDYDAADIDISGMSWAGVAVAFLSRAVEVWCGSQWDALEGGFDWAEPDEVYNESEKYRHWIDVACKALGLPADDGPSMLDADVALALFVQELNPTQAPAYRDDLVAVEPEPAPEPARRKREQTAMSRVFRLAANTANDIADLPDDVMTGGLCDAAMHVVASAMRLALGVEPPNPAMDDRFDRWAAEMFRAAANGSRFTPETARAVWQSYQGLS